MENMNTFKRKALFTAVVAGLGVAGTAEAVYMSPNRTGQVLVYPYYTVQSAGGNNWNTYISVVNTTTIAKAVKVRILEGKTSAEVLDFNLFLSPNDVWTAAIIPNDATATAPGRLVTTDTSCTRPAIQAAGVPFRNFQYSVAGSGDALPGTGLERTREGYVEILEMAALSGATATAVTHTSSGSPANCGVVQAAGFLAIPVAEQLPPRGGLMGTGTLINVNNGRDAGYKADALDAWRDAPIYTDSGFVTPNLADASPASSLVVRSGDIDTAGTGASTLITAYRSDFLATSGSTAGARAVASVFMHTSVLNEYILDNASASLTDWVITQPLKNLFVNNATARQPYSNILTSSGACETIGFVFFNREESGAVALGSDFSPRPPDAPGNTLCWESTVVSIRNTATHMPTDTTRSAVLGSANITNITVNTGFQNGWAALAFTGPGAVSLGMGSAAGQRVALGTNLAAPSTPVVTAGVVTFFGLPVTGFMVRTFSNGSLTCGTAACQGNYGALFNHSYTTVVTP
jgi:hypothetical protein